MIVCMLHNMKLDRYHPIFFRMSPLPGNPDKLIRYKSAGHHTDGFASREEAIASTEDERFKDFELDFGSDFEWDGEDIPALVIFRENK